MVGRRDLEEEHSVQSRAGRVHLDLKMVVPARVDLSTYDIPLLQCWVHIIGFDASIFFWLRSMRYIMIISVQMPSFRAPEDT